MDEITGTDLESLQFETIFRNRFGVLPADLGLTTNSYSATGNGHTVSLHVVDGKIISGWLMDGAFLMEDRILARDTVQARNLTLLKTTLGL